MTRNDDGDTPLHAAAAAGYFRQIPAGLLTAEMVGLRNYTGVTPYAAAAHAGYSDQIPPQFRPKPPGPLQQAMIKLGFSKPPF